MIERSEALDGVRGAAVLIVFLSHTSGREMVLTPWLDMQGVGHIGVYLFFVLSGFLLTRNLLDGQKSGAYLVRRFFRIAPLYYTVLAGVLVYQAMGSYSPRYLHISDGAEGALLHFLFLKGDSVFWTLAAEFAFYLLLPAIVAGIVRFGRAWLVVATVVYFLWSYAVQYGAPLPAPKFVDIAHSSQFLDVFACGVLAATIRSPVSDKLAAGAFAALLALTFICVSDNFLGADQPWFGLRWLSLLYGVVFGLAVASIAQGGVLAAPMRWRWLCFIGKCGYGWYLLHFPVFQIVNTLDAPAPLRFILAAAILSIVAWLALILIERPMNGFGRSITRVRFTPDLSKLIVR